MLHRITSKADLLAWLLRFGKRVKGPQAKTMVVLLSILSTILFAQSEFDQHQSVNATQTRGYWQDAATGLTWAAKDNGYDLTWRKAIKYCSGLRLAGYADWRLPSIDELQGIYDASGYDQPHPKDVELVLAGKPKGGLLLTGSHHWSSTKGKDDRGHSNGYAWYFDFSHGWRRWDPNGYQANKRALCVRTVMDPAIPGSPQKK